MPFALNAWEGFFVEQNFLLGLLLCSIEFPACRIVGMVLREKV